ncbi:MAG: FKBP-type peptidyl-prolyl cis-trans isomerase [Promethearchaeota archaeon]
MQKWVTICLISLTLLSGNVNYVFAETKADWGDTVTVDYVLTVDNVEEDSGRLSNVVLGSGVYLPEFEEAIVGMTVEQTVNIVVEPEGGYPSGHPLGDKYLHFEITLVSIDKKGSQGESSDDNLFIWIAVILVLLGLAIGGGLLLFGGYFTQSPSTLKAETVYREKKISALREIREIAEKGCKPQEKEIKRPIRRR